MTKILKKYQKKIERLNFVYQKIKINNTIEKLN